jgi:predicted nucleic acid-binding protein
MKRVLTDTGPLVAILSPNDHNHVRCLSVWKELPNPLLTCWPVITEAAWMLRMRPQAVKKMLEGIQNGIVELAEFCCSEAGRISEVLEQYESLRPQFADAALVYLAHREDIETIFTLDRRDFSVYRNSRKKPFYLLP